MAYWTAPEVKLDPQSVANFNARMHQYAEGLRKGLFDTLHQFAGRLAEELMRETPPFVDKKASNTLEAKRRGERAVEDALLESVTPASYIFDKPFTNSTLETIVKRKQYSKWNDATKNMPKLRRWSAKPFTSDLHFGNRPQGRYDKIKEKLIVTFDERKWKQHLKQVQSRVGYMKAGWGVSAAKLGRPVPEWIARHLAYAKGSTEIVEHADRPLIVLHNYTPTIGRFSSRYNYAMDQIGPKMIKQMQQILRAEAKKAKLAQ